MVNVKLQVSYDGTEYHGFQEQENVRTIGGLLSAAITKITGTPIELICAGRTDKGVHAEGQIVNFLTNQTRLKEYNWIRALNSMLPSTIRITDCVYAPETFHARFDAVAREYWYNIINTNFPHALQTRFATHVYYPLDIDILNEYCARFKGTHDFTAFCSVMDQSNVKIRTIYDIKTVRSADLITIKIKGSAFLHNMVRIITGTLLDFYRKQVPAEQITHVINSGNRQLAGTTMPPTGLIFKKVCYAEEEIYSEL